MRINIVLKNATNWLVNYLRDSLAIISCSKKVMANQNRL
jgi:hypothetical protein